MKPIAMTTLPERGTSVLHFADYDASGEYFMRCGVCWPVMPPGAIRAEGAALICGMNTRTKSVRVFECATFSAIENVIETDTDEFGYPRPRIVHVGIAQLLNRAFAEYGARRWYYNQSDAVHLPYAHLITRSGNINPKPVFDLVPWDSDQDAKARMIIEAEHVEAEPGTVLEQQMNTFQGRHGAAAMIEFPAIHALACVLLGLVRWPWNKEHVEIWPPNRR